jgi:hypothetical protein
MRSPLAVALSTFLMTALPIHSQDRRNANDNNIYQVKFSIRDASDAAAKSTRNYSLITAANRKATFRVGDRIPLATAAFQPGPSGSTPVVSTQFQYLDIGVSIECIIADIGGKVGMHGNIDLSTIEHHDSKGAAVNPNPTVGQTRLELDTAVALGNPTIVASIDDPVNMRKLEVEATVTKMD